MAGYVCTIAGGKGGVGKTTAAINLGVALESAGRDVVVVDADLGMANLGAALGVDAEGTVHDVLGDDADVDDALTAGPDGLTVLPGDERLEAFAEADPSNLSAVIEALRERYDAVIVDTGAGLSHEVAVPLGLADGVVLVTTPDDVAVEDTAKTAQLTDRVGGTVLGVVVNRVTLDTDAKGLAERLGHELLAALPDDPAADGSEPTVTSAPESPTADGYRQLADVLAGAWFDEQSLADAEPVLERSWFVDESETDGEPTSTAASDGGEVSANGEGGRGDDGDRDDERSGGVFGLFN